MWEGDPVGVDPKRPLVGFALVAVLCAVLMTLSVGKGWSFDFLQPGRPIASSVGGHVERAPVPSPDAAEPVEVGIPVQLSTAPLGSASAAPAKTRAAARPATSSAGVIQDDSSGRHASSIVRTEQTPEVPADARAERQAEKAARHAEKAAEKAARDAEKAARDAEKAAGKAAHDAEKLLRDAEKHAAKAARDAEKAAGKVAHDAEKVLRDAEKHAAKAARDAEKAAGQAAHDAEKLLRDAEKHAAKAARDAENAVRKG
jgi:hypothetical protein